MKEARDGTVAFHIYFSPPKLRLYSPPTKEEWIRQLEIEKPRSLTPKRYLEYGNGCTKVMIPCHLVPKILTDIRVVWNCTGNGVNPSIYTQSLFPPSADTVYRNIEINMD